MISYFIKSNYIMKAFSAHHLVGLSISVSIGFLIYLIFYFSKNKGAVAKNLGYLLIAFKIFETIYRIFVERYPLYDNLPLHMCNIAYIIACFYLITRKKVFFEILYHFAYAAIVVVIFPSGFAYTTGFYIIIFMFTHVIEIMTVIYALRFFNANISKYSLIKSICFYLISIGLAYLINIKLNTNFFYINDYILSNLSFMGYKVYVVVYLIANVLAMYISNKFFKIFKKII